MTENNYVTNNIIYEDKNILAVYKRAGLATQTSKLGEKDLVSEVLNYIKAKNPKKAPYAGLINRLDQPVEGIVLFGLDKNTTASLTEQLQAGGIDKHYYAAVHGIPSKENALVVDYMCKDSRSNLSRICEADETGAQKAILEYKLVGTKEDISLLDIHLITGRHHQIRVQLAGAKLPLLGDRKYAPDETEARSEELSIRTVALCSYSLKFTHPQSGEFVELKIEPQGLWYSLITE